MNPTPPQPATPQPPLTATQREEFLRAQGWTPELPETEREALENYWTDEDIKMARGLGLS